MALDGTRDGLIASIAAWMDRTDLTAVIPDFITLFETAANQEGAIRTLFNKTSTSISTSTSNNYISTPSDFMAVDSLVNTGVTPLETVIPFGTAAALYTAYPLAAQGGRPKGFIQLAGKIELANKPDAVYPLQLYYFQKIPALTAAAPANWLLTNYPNLYLFGSLVAAEAYLGSDPRIQTWGNFYSDFIAKLEGSTERAQFGGAALAVRTDVTV